MTLSLIAVSVLALAAVIALTLIAIRSTLSTGPTLASKTVIVHTRRPDDQSLRGILVAQHADRITLSEVVHLYASGDQAVAGSVHIPLVNVSTIQEIDPSVAALAPE